ncbi:MAG: hypothetical protein ACRENW_03455, partial [Thermodesulfobacteriota bacterium]
GLKREWISLNIVPVGIKQIANWKISKMKGDHLKKFKQGIMLYKAKGNKILLKGFQATLLKEILISVLGKKRGYQISTILRKPTPNSFPLNLFTESTRTIVINASQGILKNLSKADLISPLIDSGAASVEAAYIVLKAKMTKRDALNHVIKEATGTINSSVAVLGTLLILRALSYVPTPGRIAILIVAKIALKKFRNR